MNGFNWRTSLAGAFVVAAAGVETFLGVDIPGFNLGLAEAVTIAGGLFFAADGAALKSILPRF